VNLSIFQKPSRYINHEINIIHKEAPVKVALVFPDIYEIGMSHLGLRILYKIINDIPYAAAERVFAPWNDFRNYLKANSLPLSSLESKRPLKDFDIIGFSLQYELSYTTVLDILNLGNIPFKTEERLSLNYPLVIAGGPCTVNPLPLSPFIDAFLIGDGEEAILEITNTYNRWKKEGDGRKESLLKKLSEIEGIYIPLFQNENLLSNNNPVSFFVKRRFVKSLDSAPYPDNPIVPYTAIVHDRVNIEVSRGCSMGCRFCQAGMIYRPVRERSPRQVLKLAENSLKNTGYEEVSFTSLSAGDYSCLIEVLREFNKRYSGKNIALSLPSLRIAAVNREILHEIRTVKKTGFTIAPEAGTDRLRRVINKDFSEEEYEKSLSLLFEEGWLNLKLYFMIGLPTETDEDIDGISRMAYKALKIARKNSRRPVNINIGISPFIPKPHTPFQWHGQEQIEEIIRKKRLIENALSKKSFNIKSHNVHMSFLEAAFSRGDEKMSKLIEKAWLLGCRLDGWTENFDFQKWQNAMESTGIDAGYYASKKYSLDNNLPWDFIDTGISKNFLIKEYNRALYEKITPDCKKHCHNCGLGCHIKNIENKDSSIISESTGVAFSRAHVFNPVKIRVEFSKTGVLKYLSHLELIFVIHRAIRRAGIKLDYSKGFNPKPEISFGPPLRVGISGLSEYFDMKVFPPFDLYDNKDKLNLCLPEGININQMSPVPLDSQSLNSFISCYEYRISGGDILSMKDFLDKKEIVTKREKYVINLRAMVESAIIGEDNYVTLILKDLNEGKVRIGEILPIIFNTPFEKLSITRTGLYGWDNKWIKPSNISHVPLFECKV